jgi:hypothetical protein
VGAGRAGGGAEAALEAAREALSARVSRESKRRRRATPAFFFLFLPMQSRSASS